MIPILVGMVDAYEEEKKGDDFSWLVAGGKAALVAVLTAVASWLSALPPNEAAEVAFLAAIGAAACNYVKVKILEGKN